MTEPTERIAKYLARCGVASRRGSEKLIEQGRVGVNGKVIDSPALNVGASDVITLNGQVVTADEQTRMWLYNKPSGLVTTHKDPEGRTTVFEALPADMPRVVSVGRLDLTSEGLLLLTTSGELAGKLEHPSTGWKRKYRVRLRGTPSPATLKQLTKGVTIEGMRYRPLEVEIEKSGNNSWLFVNLREGKNREIRKIFEHFGHPVSRLIRVAYGPFQLGKLSTGTLQEISAKILTEQCGHFISTK